MVPTVARHSSSRISTSDALGGGLAGCGEGAAPAKELLKDQVRATKLIKISPRLKQLRFDSLSNEVELWTLNRGREAGGVTGEEERGRSGEGREGSVGNEIEVVDEALATD